MVFSFDPFAPVVFCIGIYENYIIFFSKNLTDTPLICARSCIHDSMKSI